LKELKALAEKHGEKAEEILHSTYDGLFCLLISFLQVIIGADLALLSSAEIKKILRKKVDEAKSVGFEAAKDAKENKK
jgi:hypothetical protein